MKIRLLLVVAVSVVLVGCGGGSETKSTSEPTAAAKTQPPKKAKPKFDKAAYGKKAEASYLAAGGGRSFKEQCDDAFTSWQCFYDGVKAKSKKRIDIEMTTPGDVTENDAKDFSEKARMAYFNFIGDEFKSLDTIVTFVNGADTGTTRRADVPMLNR